mgnify:CR=1 FL=1
MKHTELQYNKVVTEEVEHTLEILDDWNDCLMWCPSQCFLPVRYKNDEYVLYLRWRHNDPWEASLIDKNGDEDFWIELTIPFFTATQLEECKEAALKTAEKILRTL